MKALSTIAKSFAIILTMATIIGITSNTSKAAIVSNIKPTGDIYQRLEKIIDSHLQDTQSNVYLNDCRVSDYYTDGDDIVVKGTFYHSGIISNTWKNFVARININSGHIRLGYWKYWVATGEWSLITTDGYKGIYPTPEKH
jgi:hypothetical protein